MHICALQNPAKISLGICPGYRCIRDSFRNARIRLEIEIKIGLKFDQAKRNSLNLRFFFEIFFLLIGSVPIQSQSLA